MEQDWTGAMLHVGVRSQHLLQALILVDKAKDGSWMRLATVKPDDKEAVYHDSPIGRPCNDDTRHGRSRRCKVIDLTANCIGSRPRKAMENNKPVSHVSHPAVSR